MSSTLTAMTADDAPTIAEIVGRNAQRIRGDRRTDEVAVAARSTGLKWGTGRVSELESGKVSPTLPTLIALCMALSDVSRRPVALADVVWHDGPVKINEALTIDGSDLTDALRGEPADWRREGTADALLAMAVRQAGGEAEQRAAQSLGITGRRFKELAAELWGRPFAEERDARAGADANAQKRGRVARQLKAEMQAALEDRVRGNGQ